MIRKIYLYILFSIISLCYAFPIHRQKTFRVTFIQSYEKNNYWSGELNKGFIDGLKTRGINADVHVEYLDSWLWKRVSEETLMRRMLQRAYNWKSDIVITAGDEATYSLMTCNSPIAHNIPVFYTGVKYPNYDLLSQYPNIQGEEEHQDFYALMNLSKELFPNKKNFIVVSENTTLGKRSFAQFIQSWIQFHKNNPEYTISTINTSDKTINDILSQLRFNANISNDVMLVPFYNQNFKWLMRIATCPCLSTNTSAEPNGGFAIYAEKRYDMAFRAGIKTADILLNHHNKTYIRPNKVVIADWKQIKFFHYDKDVLPKGSIIINESLSEKYFSLLIIASLLLSVGLFIAIINIIKRIKRDSRREMMAVAQQALVDQRNNFESIFNSILFGVISLNDNNCVYMINQTALDLMRIPNDTKQYQAIDKPIGDFMEIICDGKNILPTLVDAVNGEKGNISIPPKSFILIKYSQFSFPASGDFTLIKKGSLRNGIILSFRNTSDELMMNNWLSIAMTVGNIFTYKYDTSTNLINFSIGFLNLLNLPPYSKSILLNDLIIKYVHPDDRSIAEIFYANKQKENETLHEPKSVEIRLKNKHNEYEWWRFYFSALSRGESSLSEKYVLGICQCIQHYKDREKELIVARDKALQSDKLKTQFLANMSHEIRTPLNSIVGFSSLLTDIESYTKEETESFINIINSNCKTLLVLIDDLINLSSIESGALDFYFAKVNLSILVSEVADSYQFDKNEKVKIIANLPKKALTIDTDRERLKQVLTNLLANSKKFTKEGEIIIGYNYDHENVNLFVQDTGIGIPQEQLENIFERFYKINSYIQGAGIGLSICKTIIERLHGNISAYSELNNGSRFDINLPYKSTSESMKAH